MRRGPEEREDAYRDIMRWALDWNALTIPAQEVDSHGLHVSNVAVVDSKGKATRVGFRVEGDKKVRFAKTTGEVING